MNHSIKTQLLHMFLLFLIKNVQCYRGGPVYSCQNDSLLVVRICRNGYSVTLHSPLDDSTYTIRPAVNLKIKKPLTVPEFMMEKENSERSTYTNCDVELWEGDRLSFVVREWDGADKTLRNVNILNITLKKDHFASNCSCSYENAQMQIQQRQETIQNCTLDSLKLDTILQEQSTLFTRYSKIEEELKELLEISDIFVEKNPEGRKVLITGTDPLGYGLLAVVEELLDQLELRSILKNIASVAIGNKGIILEMNSSRNAIKIIARSDTKLVNSGVFVRSCVSNNIICN